MIVCSCNCISSREIELAVDDVISGDPMRVVTPGQVYRSLGKRPRCGVCLTHAASLINARVDCHRSCDTCPLARHALGLSASQEQQHESRHDSEIAVAISL